MKKWTIILLLTLTLTTITTMADHKKLIPIIKKWEGGFANHPNDKGGATNSGITLTTFRQYFGKNKTVNDLKRMTEWQWEYIFKRGFWDRYQADSIVNQSVANLLVDYVWASGIYGIKYPQQVLGVTADGIIGPVTLAAINEYPDQEELFNKLWNRRKEHFNAIVRKNPSQKVFLRGWLNRLNDFKYEG